MKTKIANLYHSFSRAVCAGTLLPLAATLKAQNLFVGNYGNNTIGEYGLDGSTVNASLISGLDGPVDIAIGSVPEPSVMGLFALGLGGLALRHRKTQSH
jgi:hypothetical protein